MQDPSDRLTPNQVTALTALLAGRNVRAVAKAAGVDPATVHRWLNESDFQAAYRAGRRVLAITGLAQLQDLTASAVEVIKGIMNDKKNSASIRLRAAQIVVTATVEWLKLEDMEARLSELEAKYAQKL